MSTPMMVEILTDLRRGDKNISCAMHPSCCESRSLSDQKKPLPSLDKSYRSPSAEEAGVGGHVATPMGIRSCAISSLTDTTGLTMKSSGQPPPSNWIRFFSPLNPSPQTTPRKPSLQPHPSLLPRRHRLLPLARHPQVPKNGKKLRGFDLSSAQISRGQEAESRGK